MHNSSTGKIIDHLWHWFKTSKDNEVIKDVSKSGNIKFDCYLNSHISDPLSLTVFELSDKSELIVNDIKKLAESQAAYFLFVNTKAGWMIAVKNTPENVRKISQGEKIQNFKIKVIN